MAFAILRTSKIKTMGNISSSALHNYRERETLNADPARLKENVHKGANSKDDLIQKVKEILPANRRKDAVLTIEYLITASRDIFNDPAFNKDAYFEDAVKWLKAKHGAENVVATSVHNDETTPHLVAYVVPILNGTLNAKHFLGGRAKLSEMQTDFANTVASKYGLQRGIEKSKSKHVEIAKYYAETNEPIHEIPALPKLPKKLAPPTLIERIPMIDAKIERDKKEEQYRESIKAYKREHLKSLKEGYRVAESFQRSAIESSRLKKRVFELNKSAASKDSQISDLKSKIQRSDKAMKDIQEQIILNEKKAARSIAMIIKKSYTNEELAKHLDIELEAGKADIFDALVKSKRANDFYHAVEIVSLLLPTLERSELHIEKSRESVNKLFSHRGAKPLAASPSRKY